MNGELQFSKPKTKSSIRKIVLPPAVLEVLREYQQRVHSRWMFPSPVKEDSPLSPARCVHASNSFWNTLSASMCGFTTCVIPSQRWHCRLVWM